MIKVESTNLDEVGYDETTLKLTIKFKNHSVYEYSNVPSYIYQGLMYAPSKGQYHAAYIKERFAFRRIV